MIRVVVFDLGQVLASPDDIYSTPAALLDVEPEAYEALYWRERVAYDTGGSRVAYWKPLLQGLGVTPTGELMTQLACLDAEIWTDVRPEALALVDTVRSWELAVALLTNAPLALGRAIRDADWRDRIDHLFVSAELGLVKPDPALYEHVTRHLRVSPGEIAFIDDRPANVDAARAHGWQSHLWVDDADSHDWLTALRPPRPDRPAPSEADAAGPV